MNIEEVIKLTDLMDLALERAAKEYLAYAEKIKEMQDHCMAIWDIAEFYDDPRERGEK